MVFHELIQLFSHIYNVSTILYTYTGKKPSHFFLLKINKKEKELQKNAKTFTIFVQYGILLLYNL